LSAGSGVDSGAGGSGVQPVATTEAATTIRPKRARRTMWVIYLEVLVALAVAVLIVWWTWPRKK
jgi:hypothetical protein